MLTRACIFNSFASKPIESRTQGWMDLRNFDRRSSRRRWSKLNRTSRSEIERMEIILHNMGPRRWREKPENPEWNFVQPTIWMRGEICKGEDISIANHPGYTNIETNPSHRRRRARRFRFERSLTYWSKIRQMESEWRTLRRKRKKKTTIESFQENENNF